MGGAVTIAVVGLVAYSVTAAALVAAAMWGLVAAMDLEDVERFQRRRMRAASAAILLAVVQALLWARIGAGLGG